MARMASRRPPAREGITGMKFSEMIVIVLVIAMVIAGARYYFLVYKKSPGFVLGEFLGAVKRGNVAAQYAMLDKDDLKSYPSVSDYERTPLAHGYTERIANVSLAQEVVDPKNPSIVTVEATVTVRKSGQEVYQTGTDSFTDKYKLRKTPDGEWKVWLNRSTINLLKATPNKPGDPI